MAGARSGGAELFFERLSAALHRAGDAVLPVIRRDPHRADRLRTAGLAPAQLRFGGPIDLLTRPRLARLLRAFAPEIAVAWMNRAARAMPDGPWVKVGRLGGYYDLKYYRNCDHLVGNTRGIVAWIRAQGWPPDRVHHLPNFAPDLRGATPADLPPGPRLLALGRLHANKAFDILIRALRRSPASRPSSPATAPNAPSSKAWPRNAASPTGSTCLAGAATRPPSSPPATSWSARAGSSRSAMSSSKRSRPAARSSPPPLPGRSS